MSRRFQLVLAGLWAVAICVAAVLDAPSSLISMMPVIAIVTILPGGRRCPPERRAAA